MKGFFTTAANDGALGDLRYRNEARRVEGSDAQSADAHQQTHYSSGDIGGHFDRIGGVP